MSCKHTAQVRVMEPVSVTGAKAVSGSAWRSSMYRCLSLENRPGEFIRFPLHVSQGCEILPAHPSLTPGSLVRHGGRNDGRQPVRTPAATTGRNDPDGLSRRPGLSGICRDMNIRTGSARWDCCNAIRGSGSEERG